MMWNACKISHYQYWCCWPGYFTETLILTFSCTYVSYVRLVRILIDAFFWWRWGISLLIGACTHWTSLFCLCGLFEWNGLLCGISYIVISVFFYTKYKPVEKLLTEFFLVISFSVRYLNECLPFHPCSYLWSSKCWEPHYYSLGMQLIWYTRYFYLPFKCLLCSDYAKSPILEFVCSSQVLNYSSQNPNAFWKIKHIFINICIAQFTVASTLHAFSQCF